MKQYLMTHDCYDPQKEVVFKKGKIYAEADFEPSLLKQYKEHKLAVPAPSAQTTATPLKLDKEGKVVKPEITQAKKAAKKSAKPAKKLDTSKADKQAEKDQKAATKQAEKDAKAAAKQAEKDAKEAAKADEAVSTDHDDLFDDDFEDDFLGE